MAGVLGIEPRSSVLETDILTAVLYPYSSSYHYINPSSKCKSYQALISPARLLSAILIRMKSLSLTTPRVIFVIGKPGVGKTQFASKFAETFNVPYVEADQVRGIITQDPVYDTAEQKTVDRLVMLQISELLKTSQTFLVETSTEAKVDRQNFAKWIRKHNYEPLFVWVQTDGDTAYDRATRASRVNKDKIFILPDERYAHLAKRFTAPGEEEKAVVISGKHTYASQLRAILRRLADPNRPAQTPLTVPKRQTLKGNSIKIG